MKFKVGESERCFCFAKTLRSLSLPVVAKEKIRLLKDFMDKPVRRKKLPPGRPRKVVKKEITIGTRFSKIEQFIIKQKAGKAGLKPSEYIRQLALTGIVKARITDEERHFVRQLVGMANNLNQLTKLAHQQGLIRTVMHFEEYRNKIDELLKALKNGE